MRIKDLPKRRAVCAVLFTLLLSAVGLTNATAQTFTVGNLNYSINEDGVSVTVTGFADNVADTGELIIPDVITKWGNTYPVTAIGEQAFYYRRGITSVIIGNNVTRIGDNSFYGTSFNAVSIPLSVTYIGYYAFESSNLTSVTIPSSVTQIGDFAFAYCNNLTTVNYNATNCGGSDWFHESPLSNLNIGGNVEVIPYGFVNGQSGLVGELVIPASVTSIGGLAFSGCTGFTGDLNIPNSVTYIGEQAFSNCSGFSGTLTIGQSLTQIGNSAFFGACENFTSFNVKAETPPSLGTNVFTSANYGIPVQVPCGSLDAYQNADGWNVFTNIQEPNPCFWNITATANPENAGTVSGTGIYEQGTTCTLTATATGDFEFSHWTENGVTVSTNAQYSFIVESNRSIVAHFISPNFISFADPIVEARCVELWDTDGDGFLSYDEAASVTSLNYAFQNWDNITSFDELQYFTGLTTIYDWEMAACDNLVSITLPESLTTISYAAFEYSYSLQSIVIPENVTYIGGWAFSYCYSLTSFELKAATPPNISDDCPFCNTNMDNVVITVPCGTTNTYRNTNVWNWYSNYQEPVDCVYYTITAMANPSDGGEVAFANPQTEPFTNFQPSAWFDFEDGTLQGWTIIDADGDGQNWHVRTNGNYDGFDDLYSHGGSYYLASFSYYNNSLNPDNYLVSPELPTPTAINYYVAGQPRYLDHYGVYVSFTGNDPSDFFLVFEETLPAAKGNADGDNTIKGKEGDRSVGPTPWFQRTIGLPEGTKYVAFRHFGSYDKYFVILDDITFGEVLIETTYADSTFCVLTASPYYGYNFENWTEGGTVVSTDVEYSFMVTGERDLVANFSKTPFNITAIPNFDDRGSVSGMGEYVINANCTLTATPSEGHSFVRWVENGQEISTEARYSFTVRGPRELVAVFTAHEDDIIHFVDANVKAICVSNWDTDGDGELTYAEAAAVTDLGLVFRYQQDITSFDELQYFTGLSYLNQSEFYNSSITSVVLPSSLTSIGNSAFMECYSLISVTLPENLGGIDVYTFASCYNLMSIEIPNSVTQIGDGAFDHCYSLSAVDIPSGVTYIGESAFNSCHSLSSIELPSSLEYLGAWAFAWCSGLNSIEIPRSLTGINYGSFQGCSGLVGSLELPSSITFISNEAFSGCSNLTSVVLPEHLYNIGSSAFRGCSGFRGELTLPENLYYVGDHAFYGCDGISKVNYNAINCQTMGSTEAPVFYDCAFTCLNIGENVETIPNFAFKRCFMITEMNVAASVPPIIYSSTFGMVSRSIPVSVPMGSGEAYRTAQYWEEFFNITEDYTPTNYAYHWNVNANQFENNMNVIGIIQIEGVEQATNTLEIGAFVGDECRGRQFLAEYANFGRYFVFLTLYGEDGDVFSFRLYDHETNTESLLGCTSHITFETNDVIGTPLDPFVFNFTSLQATSFNDGWTWWSTYVEQEGIDGLQMLEEGLGDNGAVIKSQNGFVNNTEGFWYGTLNTLNNETSYMVKTHAATCVDLIGNMVDPSAHPVTLYSGWTWVGYPSMLPMSLEEALSGFEASGGDVLKTQSNGFAYYTENFGWSGSLNTIKPGMGLMYKSNSPANVVFTYPNNTTRGDLKANLTAADNHWVPNLTDYPYNMSVMAVVELDGIEIGSNQYELAAFANGECRGSVRLLFVEPLNRYLAFLSIAGEETAELRFALYDSMTGEERFNGDETIPFEANAIVGDVEDPLVIHFRGTTSVDELGSSLQVYPNPATGGEMLYIGMAEVDGEVRVETINALGEVVSIQTPTMQAASIKAPSAPGIYLLRITVEGKGTSCHRLIVK